MRYMILAVLTVFGLAGPAAASDTTAASVDATHIQFRDLFDQDRKPSDQATHIAGDRVRIVGFAAPQVFDNAPYFVLVGAPVQVCPFCEAGLDDEESNLPYLLVYAEEMPVKPGGRMRLLVEGALEVGLAYDEAAGLPNMIRLRNATVRPDQPASRLSRFLKPGAAAERPAAPRGFDLDAAEDN